MAKAIDTNVDRPFEELEASEKLALERSQQAAVSRSARQSRDRAVEATRPDAGGILGLPDFPALTEALNPTAAPRSVTSPKGPISARELGVGSTLDLNKEEPEKILNVVAEGKDGVSKRYEILAQSEGQARAVMNYFGVEPKSSIFSDEQLALASRLGDKAGDSISSGLHGVKDRAKELARGIEMLNPDSDLIRQLSANPFDARGAFRMGDRLARLDNLSDQAQMIEAFLPGSVAKVEPNEHGENQVFVRLAGKSKYVPLDVSGFPVGGKKGSILAELGGDIGLLEGEILNATTASIIMGQKILPNTKLFHFLSGKAPGVVKEAASPLVNYYRQAANTIARRGLARWAYATGFTGASASFGSVIDDGIENWKGFQHDSWGQIIDEAQSVGTFVAGLEGGMRLSASALSLFSAPAIRSLLRAKDENVIALMDAARRYNIPITVADMHPIAAALALQSQGLSSRQAAFFRDRDVFTRAGLKGFIEANFGATGITSSEVILAARVAKSNINKILDDPTSTIGATSALREGLIDYIMADRKGTLDRVGAAAAEVGGATFNISRISRISKDAEAGGTRFLLSDVTFDKLGRPRIEGKLVSWSDATKRFYDEPLDARLTDLFTWVNELNPLLRTLPVISRDGSPNSAIHQLAKIRQKAFALTDTPMNDVSAWTASQIYKESVRLMREPGNVGRASAGFKTRMETLDKYMAESEEIFTKLWAKRLLDPNQGVKYAEDYDLGQFYINLQRHELIGQLKSLMEGGEARGLPRGVNRWEEVRKGFTANLLSDPLGSIRKITDPENAIGLGILYSKGERKSLEKMANMLMDMEKGTLARFMQSHADAVVAPLELWKKKDVNGLKILMDEFGGPDTPQGRRMASSFFSMIVDTNWVKIDGIDVLDKKKVAAAFSEMRAQGWLDALVGPNQARLMDIRGMEQALDVMIGQAGMANKLITAGVAQSLTGGMIDSGRSARGVKKWFANYLAGRFLVSPFMFRAAGLTSPRYMGPVQGKYLVPPDMSYLRTFVNILEANYNIIREDAKQIDLGSSPTFDLGDLPITDKSGPSIVIPDSASLPPRTATPGQGALGLPNIPNEEPGPLIPPLSLGEQVKRTQSQTPRRSGGGLPTGAAAGRPAQSRPTPGQR